MTTYSGQLPTLISGWNIVSPEITEAFGDRPLEMETPEQTTEKYGEGKPETDKDE